MLDILVKAQMYQMSNTIEVKVITKTSETFGTGSSYGYTLDGIESPHLELSHGTNLI